MTDLPPGWEWAPLDEIADVRLGRQRSPKNHTGNQMRRYLRAANVGWDGLRLDDAKMMNFTDDEVKTYRLEYGDIVVSEASGSPGEVGKPALWRGEIEECCLQNTLIRVRSSGAVEPAYLLNFLRTEALRGAFAERSRGVGIHHLGSTRLAKWMIPLPPLSEQRRIVATLEQHLSCLDEGTRIAENSSLRQQQLENVLLEYAVTGKLSSSMTTDGSASELVAQSRDRVSACQKPRPATARKLPHAASLALGKAALPGSWKWAEWGQLGLSQNGIPFPSSDYQQSGVRLIRPGNLTASGFIDWASKNTRNLPESYALKHSSLIVPADSLIMNLTAQSLKDNFLGRTCMKIDREPALLNQRLAWLKPAMMNSRYLWLVFRSPLFRRFVDQLNSGSLIQHINTWQVEKFMVPVPPIEEQIRIVERHAELSDRIRRGSELARAFISRVDILRNEILADVSYGRLVPQDSSDEPATVLLERIKTERVAPRKSNRDRLKAKRINPGQESMS